MRSNSFFTDTEDEKGNKLPISNHHLTENIISFYFIFSREKFFFFLIYQSQLTQTNSHILSQGFVILCPSTDSITCLSSANYSVEIHSCYHGCRSPGNPPYAIACQMIDAHFQTNTIRSCERTAKTMSEYSIHLNECGWRIRTPSVQLIHTDTPTFTSWHTKSFAGFMGNYFLQPGSYFYTRRHCKEVPHFETHPQVHNRVVQTRRQSRYSKYKKM